MNKKLKDTLMMGVPYPLKPKPYKQAGRNGTLVLTKKKQPMIQNPYNLALDKASDNEA